jgi:hypothetical protein
VTGKQQVLAILADGRRHSHTELYRRARANPNVVSKLRKDGYVITCERFGQGYWYRLVSSPRPEPAPLADGTVPELAPGQVSLEDVL